MRHVILRQKDGRLILMRVSSSRLTVATPARQDFFVEGNSAQREIEFRLALKQTSARSKHTPTVDREA